MRNLLLWIRDTYGNPKIIITENGISDKGRNEEEDALIKIRYHYVNIRYLLKYFIKLNINKLFIIYRTIIFNHKLK